MDDTIDRPLVSSHGRDANEVAEECHGVLQVSPQRTIQCCAIN